MFQLKSVKIALGVFTLLPFALVIGASFYVLIETVLILFSDTEVNPFLILGYLTYVVPVFAAYSTYSLILVFIYALHIFQNNFFDQEKRYLWLTIILVLNSLAMPIYWYFHLWKGAETSNGKLKSQ
jgi:hypothetical protein